MTKETVGRKTLLKFCPAKFNFLDIYMYQCEVNCMFPISLNYKPHKINNKSFILCSACASPSTTVPFIYISKITEDDVGLIKILEFLDHSCYRKKL